jgi:cytochrome c biogenesis factor
VTATLDVFRDGKPAGTVKPRVVYPKQLAEERSSTMKVSLIQQPLKDIFVSFNGVDQAGNAVFTVKYFPMQWWVWAGFIVTILGSALASWPKRLPKAA